MPVVLAVLDAFPHHELSPDRTPNLWRLAAEGGRSVDGGVAELPAVASPNHASFVTGRSGTEHGVVGNSVAIDGEWIPAAEVGPEVATLFDACRSEQRRTAIVVGDHNLIGVCGAEAADAAWPSSAMTPSDAAAGGTSAPFVSDQVVVAEVQRIGPSGYDLLFVQFTEFDRVSRRYGPTSDEAQAQMTATDAALGRVLAMFDLLWQDTVVFVVSDHSQEPVSSAAPVDLRPFLPDDVMVAAQGTAALVVGPVGPADLLAVRGVTGYRSLDADHHVVWGDSGQVFGPASSTARGDHGSPRTASQLAVVGGGATQVGGFARRVEQRRPAATVWATWVAEALGLRWRPESSP